MKRASRPPRRYGQELFCRRLPAFERPPPAPALIDMPNVRKICAQFDTATGPPLTAADLPPLHPPGYLQKRAADQRVRC